VRAIALSDPIFRVIEERRAKPSLASIAPKVKIIAKIKVWKCVDWPIKNNAERVRVKIKNSSLRRVIKIWFRCDARLISAKKIRKIII